MMRLILYGALHITLFLAAFDCVSFAQASAPAAASVEMNAKQYRHKYMFTQKKQTTTNCIRIVATAMKALSGYKLCKASKNSGVPVESPIAKCEKSDGTSAYVFETFDECTAAKAVADEPSAS